ncbi:MAG: hypothetical protein PHU42_00220 [Patescibacteria group bacterium]|nr:hypothetical protein [Patescibacteria group bacterium]
MKKTSIVLTSFLQAIGTLIYVMIVVVIMNSGTKTLDQTDGALVGVAVLMLLVVSAAICGFLVFGKPVILFLENKKKEALKMLYFTIGWLALFTIIILVIARTGLIR